VLVTKYKKMVFCICSHFKLKRPLHFCFHNFVLYPFSCIVWQTDLSTETKWLGASSVLDFWVTLTLLESLDSNKKDQFTPSLLFSQIQTYQGEGLRMLNGIILFTNIRQAKNRQIKNCSIIRCLFHFHS
jgi:hypothetical protein